MPESLRQWVDLDPFLDRVERVLADNEDIAREARDRTPPDLRRKAREHMAARRG
jgi:hypothetical protein